MLTKRIKTLFREVKSDTNGNAMILMALGMPILIGSSGMAVDMTQWYMWKRELQYAVDQAAVAGAWARAEAATESTYQTRAGQEFTANLDALTGKATNPVVALADFNGGTDNSVTVSSDVTVTLPFSQVILSRSTTIAARAQATFEAATNWTTCLLALDPSASGALELGGNTSGTVTCGAGAISTSGTAIVKNGSPSVTLGDIISAGGIDSGLVGNGSIHQYVSNLSNPYDGLTPPSNTTSQTYGCVETTTTRQVPNSSTTATAGSVVRSTVIEYTYWQGSNTNSANTPVQHEDGLSPSESTENLGQTVVAWDAEEGKPYEYSWSGDWTGRKWDASGSNKKVFEYKKTTIFYTPYSIVYSGPMDTETVTEEKATLYPGAYTDIEIDCDSHFMPGVYSISGVLDFGSNHVVTGDDVMMVLAGSGSERFKLNSQSVVRMSGITEATLTGFPYNVPAEDALRMAGMLIFDPNSTADVSINGGADMQLDGILYMPNRQATFNGNSSVTGQCMMIAAGKLKFTGTNNLNSFCVPTGAQSFDIGGNTISIRLVS